MNAMAGPPTGGETEGGPMWGRFFDSIGQDDTESALSGSFLPPDIHPLSSLHSTSHLQQSPRSEVHPNDSASVVGDEARSDVGGYIRPGVVPSVAGGALPVDDGTYVFKFRTPSGRTHRFQSRHDDIEHLRDIVSGKLATDPWFTDLELAASDIRPDPFDFHLSYTDADGDTVLMTSDHDVTDAVKIARTGGTDRVVLFVQGGKGWAEAGAGKGEARAAEKAAAAQEEVKAVEKTEDFPPLPSQVVVPAPLPPSHQPSYEDRPKPQDDVMGIPKDLLLPASIGALAVAVIAVFTISRLTASRY